MNILVTGATGLVGSLIARRLVFDGHRVHVLVRDPDRAAHVKGIVAKVITADLTVPVTLNRALADIETVVHCAGLVGSGRGKSEDYFRINVEGTRALVQAACERGAKRFVFMSTVGVYGLNMLKGNVDETTPLRNSNGYTNSKIAAEEIVRNSGLDYVIIRPYWITGGGDRFLIPAMAPMLRSGRFTYLGDGQQEWSLSVVENVGDAVALAAVHPNARNQVYNVADATVKVSETIEVIARTLGLPVPDRHSSPLSIALKALFNSSQDDPGRMTIDLFFPLWRSMTVNAEKIRRDLGWSPHIPWQDSVHEGTLEWMKQHPA
jgi:nucleoside-diphosphate-sugar epimerase